MNGKVDEWKSGSPNYKMAAISYEIPIPQPIYRGQTDTPGKGGYVEQFLRNGLALI